MTDIVERLRSSAPLPLCPFERRSPEYWTTPNDKPCKFCGGLPEGPDKCTGADMRILLEAADEIDKQLALIETLVKALEQIRDIEPQAFNAYPADWNEQIAACDDCQRYKDHPLMRGICDTHRRPMYDRESHDAHQVRALGYRAKSMARDALYAAKEITQ